MGLIKAGIGALGGVLADQWREYIYCDSIGADVLCVKGQKRTSKRSSNIKGEENIISNGSIIAVNEGQCMIIVDQGKVTEVSCETGEFVYDSSTEPSVFYGSFGENLKKSFQNMGSRFTFGGIPGKDQRVYFINTKEIIGNKYGTPSPVPFRVVDKNIGLDVDIAIRCHGEYSYKIVDPIVFYTNVCGNVIDDYMADNLDGQLKTELMTALQPAFARISELGIRYSALPAHTTELANALNSVLSKKWSEMRGIAIASLGVSSVNASEEDEMLIKNLQKNAVLRDPTMAAATIAGAQADAMVGAAKNEGAGAFAAFAGINMAQGIGGMNAASLFDKGSQQQKSDTGWLCSCGAGNNTGKFCFECGLPKPSDGWSCDCGTVNKGKFCRECGKKKSSGAFTYKCDKCGWEPEKPENAPKFCPECGDIFDENDIK